MKLIIDYHPYQDFEGSIFHFDTLDEVFEFIRLASKNSYHTYLIEDTEDKKENDKQVL